jgi:c-di-AMP phosphodiesterase-like protein
MGFKRLLSKMPGGIYWLLLWQLVCLAWLKPSLALLGLIITLGLLWFEWRQVSRLPATPAKADLGGHYEGIARKAWLRSPIPVVLLNRKERILLASRSFTTLFPGIQRGCKLPDDVHSLLSDETESLLEVNGSKYRTAWQEYETISGTVRALYLIDESEQHRLEQLLKDQSPVLGLLHVDNYEEVLAGTPEAQRPLLKAAIDKLLTDWGQNNHAYLRRNAEDRYTLVLVGNGLARCQEDKFALLDRVKEISFGNNLPVTISIGLGTGSTDLIELAGYAQQALDLALGRGGDQAVIKTPTDFSYYGGKSMAPEKRTKVRARVIAQALRELIRGADRVLVMGHASADPDSLGAAVALAKAARDLERPGYVVLEEVTPSIDKIYDYLSEHETYHDVFVESGAASRLVSSETLLIVVDTHKPSLVEAPRLLNRVKKVVVIDHHRRAEEFIADPTLIYLESYASSTSELVTEVLQYLDEVKLTSLEATSLLAGITVDTKNFAFQTGVRTFEAAAYLRRVGADARLIQRLFQDDLASFVQRAAIIESTTLLPGGLALAKIDHATSDSQLLAAQVANELLNIEEIKASFVVYPHREGAAVSARSLGDVNVQVLMEKIGGGGHLNIAGAQLKGMTVDSAMNKLRLVLDDYLTEEGEEAE